MCVQECKTWDPTSECLSYRKLGFAAAPPPTPLTLEMSQSSFLAWATARSSVVPVSPSWIRLGPCGTSDPSRQSSTPPLLLGLSAAPKSCPGWRDSAPLGKRGSEAGSRLRAVCLGLRFNFPTPSSLAPQLSLQDFGPCGSPQLPRGSKFPPSPGRRAPTHRIAFGAHRCCVDGAALLPGGRRGTTRLTRSALSAAGESCGSKMLRGGVSAEKKRKGRGEKKPNIHTRTQNQLWGWAFSISHEATWSIWRRFLKTFRREGEFSAEKLNLPYSSGPIWDLSLLTAPQGTAVIFCTACTPRNTLLNQRMSARPISAERAGEFQPRPAPSPRTQPWPRWSSQHIN